MSTGHSPGPWRWSTGGARLEDANGTPIIGMDRVNGGMYMPGGPDSELLASAPTLRAELAAVRKERDEAVALLEKWGYQAHVFVGSHLHVGPASECLKCQTKAFFAKAKP